MFLRDYPALHTLMRPCASYESRALHSPAHEPDFYLEEDAKNRSPTMEKLVASLFHRPSVTNGAARVLLAPHAERRGASPATAPPGLTGSAWSEPNLVSRGQPRLPPLSASANHSPTGLASSTAHAELVRALMKSGHAGVELDISHILAAERMALLSKVDDFTLGGMAARDAPVNRHHDESKPPAEATSPTSPSTLISSSLGKAITMTHFHQQQKPRETHIVQDDETNDQRLEFTLEDAKRIVQLADKKKEQSEQGEVSQKSLQVGELKSTQVAIPPETRTTNLTVKTLPPPLPLSTTVKTPAAKKKKTPKKKSTSGEAISGAVTKNRRKWLPKLGPPPAPEEDSDSKETSVDIEWYFTNPELFAAISENALK